ncbi:superoxide dismutase family protein [Kitasatospora sp. NPDC050543]|uniref:superoxide dismutase family protein n=1 Tax=Kitasatospora sp. NPDC050543 TaxID=3364054 RepID=UPI00378F073F
MSAPFATALLIPLVLLPPTGPPRTVVEADFDRASAFVPSAAVSHAQDLVPYGAHVRVVVERAAGRTAVALTVSGLAPGHEFPAHVHTGACGADPAASGPHYQDVPDPVQPSTDPAYANERNELRLTLRTDGAGADAANASVAWAVRAGEARSIVLHAGHPGGALPDAAGAAGAVRASDRVACVNVPF